MTDVGRIVFLTLTHCDGEYL